MPPVTRLFSAAALTLADHRQAHLTRQRPSTGLKRTTGTQACLGEVCVLLGLVVSIEI